MVVSNTESENASDSVASDPSQLVLNHYEDVYRFAYHLAGNQSDAEDLTQQTFLTAYRKLHDVNDLSKIRSWMFTIVRNAFLKSIQRRETDLSSFEESVVAVDEPEELNLEFDEEALRLALAKMPEQYRTPILLYYFEEIGYKEIAETLSLPIGTVMSRLSRGKTFLRNELSTEE